MENINEILKEEYERQEKEEKGINPSYKTNTQGKIYIGTDGLLQSVGIPKDDYNEKDAMREQTRDLNKMMRD